MLAEGDGLLLASVGVDHHDLGHALGQRQGRLERLGQPSPDVLAPDQPVDHDLDGVVLIPGELEVRPIGQLDGGPVHPHPGKPLLRQVVEQGAVLALAAAHHRSEHQEPGALFHGQDPVDDLLWALAGDW